ncbi:MAG: hypothetical protein ACLQJ0_03490 [Steroidobacteraceae bacterium]
MKGKGIVRSVAIGLVAPVLALGALAWCIGSKLIEPDYHAVASPKCLWIVEGARHQDFLRYESTGYEAHVVTFFRQHLLAR